MDDPVLAVALRRLQLRVRVRHRDRASEAPVGWAGDCVPLSLLDGETQRRDERLAALCIGEHQQRRVDACQRPRRLERLRQHLVEVDRARQLAEDPAATAFLLGALEGALELAPELVHPGVEAAHDLGHALVCLPIRRPPHDEQNQEEHYESAQAHADSRQKSRHTPAAIENGPAD